MNSVALRMRSLMWISRGPQKTLKRAPFQEVLRLVVDVGQRQHRNSGAGISRMVSHRSGLAPSFRRTRRTRSACIRKPEVLLIKSTKRVVKRFVCGCGLQGERVLGRNVTATGYRRKDRNILQQVDAVQVSEGPHIGSRRPGCPRRTGTRQCFPTVARRFLPSGQ